MVFSPLCWQLTDIWTKGFNFAEVHDAKIINRGQFALAFVGTAFQMSTLLNRKFWDFWEGWWWYHSGVCLFLVKMTWRFLKQFLTIIRYWKGHKSLCQSHFKSFLLFQWMFGMLEMVSRMGGTLPTLHSDKRVNVKILGTYWVSQLVQVNIC